MRRQSSTDVPTSLSRWPGITEVMPCHIDSSVLSTSAATGSPSPVATTSSTPNCAPSPACRAATRVAPTGDDSSAPTTNVSAESPCHPSTIAPQSSDTTSPSWSTRSPGMPWTTSSLTEMHNVAGKPWYPRNDGVAPRSSMWAWAMASTSFVVMPARVPSADARSAEPVTRPARRIARMSSLDLRSSRVRPNISSSPPPRRGRR